MTKPIIAIEGIGKRYRIGAVKEPYLSLRDELVKWVSPAARRARAAQEEFWALKDVSFSVQAGEAVGIIGRNGAGKSTLLKILSQITPPTTGKITCRGRIASLLEVGTGFHPELTGRENIYMNGAILGMSRGEIARKFDEIVAFAEMEKFLDTPVKRYSSGMYVRLAFAVAAHLEPEILIVDEVLAVGDAQFQQKCLGKMGEVARGGRTVLFVSHNMAAIRSLTQECVCLDHGEVVHFGATPTAIDRYVTAPFVRVPADKVIDVQLYRRAGPLHSPVRFSRVWLTGAEDSSIPSFEMGEDIEINCELESTGRFATSTLSLTLTNQRGEQVLTAFSMDQGLKVPIELGRQQVSCRLCELPLSPGRYSVTLGVNETPNTTAFDVLLDYPGFEVVLRGQYSGELAWANRPWGVIHWTNTTWKVSRHTHSSKQY
jgi:lipopolysaccharide transport system ATP-binding protein